MSIYETRPLRSSPCGGKMSVMAMLRQPAINLPAALVCLCIAHHVFYRLNYKLWLVALNVMAALVSLSQIPVFRSARQIFLENVKDGFRLFGHWIGGCGRRHPSMLDHNQRFVEAPVQSLVWWQESIGTLVGG